MNELSKKSEKDGTRQSSAVKSGFRFNMVAVICFGLVAGMLGLSYAAVPLYRIFCQVTGYGGTTQKAEDFTGKISDTVITVSFDSNVAPGLNWNFKPKKRSIDLRLGEKVTAIFLAKNMGKTSSTGEASFNVSPQAAGQYFNKIECFCFTEQTLKPNESVEMPVLFFVDPDIENDPLLKTTKVITLSYTFYEQEPEEDEKTTELNSNSFQKKSVVANLKFDNSSELSSKLQ